MKPAQRFLYRGEAVGVAGHVRRPVDVIIPAQASVALPSIGGRGSGTVSGGSFGGMLSFSWAAVSVYGDYDPVAKAVTFTHGNHGRNKLPTLTKVTTEVHDLSFDSSYGGLPGHTLTVGRLTGAMESRHSRERGAEPVYTMRLEIEDLAIDGHIIDVVFDDTLLAIGTYDGLFEAPKDRRHHLPLNSTKSKKLFETDPRAAKRVKSGDPGPDYEMCTLCREIKLSKGAPGKVIGPNRLYVKNFGTIYFAEMMISAEDRRVDVLRIELGSTIGGDLLAASVGLDGHGWPPVV